MSEDHNTHKCIGIVKDKIKQTTKGGSNYILLILALGEKALAIECWKEVKDSLDFIPIGSKVEVHAWADSREYNGKYYTSLKARSVTDLGAAVKQEPPPPEKQGEDIDF